jgi:hypothetical protein
VHGNRGALYNHPSIDYGRTAEIFEAITGVALSVPEAVAFMLAVKLSRIGNALDQQFTADMVRDSIVDLAGYADCLYAVWSDATDEAIDESLAEFLDELEDE